MFSSKSVMIFFVAAFAISAHAGSAGIEIGSRKQNYSVGPVDPAIQSLVNDFQAWSLAKTLNPNTPNTMVAIPRADTNKTIGGTSEKLTQEKMESIAAGAAKDFGYALPLRRIMAYKIGYGTSVADFLNMSDAYITKSLAKGNPEKGRVLIEARNSLIAMADGKAPVEAKVLGPAVEVKDMSKELNKVQYCRNVSCDQPRLKVSIMLFGTVIEKILASGVLDEGDLAALKKTASNNYYFVKVNGRWVFEEVPVDGVGFILSVTSF